MRSSNFTFRILVACCCYIWGSTACVTGKSETKNDFAYRLQSPDRKLLLPDTLREISGISILEQGQMACVQDENGILFIYDLEKNRVEKQYTFNIDGDYEEICRVGSSMYILRSDGTLFEIRNFESPSFSVRSFISGIPANNNEGLCYDAQENRLLIACKSKAGKGPEFKDKRVIYSFDLATMKLSTAPVYEFDLEDIRAFAETEKIRFHSKPGDALKKNASRLRFATSAISIHPIENRLYLLSAVDHVLFVFERNGQLHHIEVLDPILFNKAEGIGFYPNGDMLISNEAQDKKPSLLMFNYKPGNQ